MALIVKKFGGSSVATPEKIFNIVDRVLREKQADDKIVLVVSAMGDTTDDLVALAKQVTSKPYGREMDRLLSTGEQVTIALMAMAFNERGEEYLYSAMEDYRIDIMIDKGPSARSIQIDLNPFTLVGATTRSGLLTAPLRARFGINLHLEYYDDDVLSGIIRRSSGILDVPCSVRAAAEIASRSRGTPRIANALLRRVRDFAQVKGSGSIDTEIAQFALEALNIDKYGLDEIDNKILCTIIDKFKGGPVGLTTIATALGEDAGTIEEVYEPFLIKEGFLKRTPRGREVTELAYKHLGRSLYSSQRTLFGDE